MLNPETWANQVLKKYSRLQQDHRLQLITCDFDPKCMEQNKTVLYNEVVRK